MQYDLAPAAWAALIVVCRTRQTALVRHGLAASVIRAVQAEVAAFTAEAERVLRHNQLVKSTGAATKSRLLTDIAMGDDPGAGTDASAAPASEVDLEVAAVGMLPDVAHHDTVRGVRATRVGDSGFHVSRSAVRLDRWLHCAVCARCWSGHPPPSWGSATRSTWARRSSGCWRKWCRRCTLARTTWQGQRR